MRDVVTWQDFADYLRRIRQQRGLSQRQLGEQIGCGAQHVYRLEQGKRHPSRALLHTLRRECLLDAADTQLFDAFALLLDWGCDEVERQEVTQLVPVRLSAASRSESR